MIRRPASFTLTDTLFPYPPLVRSCAADAAPRRGSRRSRRRSHRHAHAGDLRLQCTEFRVARRRPLGRQRAGALRRPDRRSEEHTSELQSLMRISYAVFCLKKKNKSHMNHMNETDKTYSTYDN